MAMAATAEDVKPRFELLHLWVNDAERYALRAISDPVMASGVDWSESIVAKNFLGVRAAFAERLALGVPPEGVFWIGDNGAAKLVRDGLFRPIPDRIGTWAFSDHLIPEVYDAVKMGNAITVLPLGIHLQNRMIYNIDILTRLGLKAPESWQALLDMAPILAEHGINAITLSDERWQMRFFVTAVLSEMLTGEELRKLLTGTAPAREFEPQLTRMVAMMLALRPYADPASHDLVWGTVVENVAVGTAFAAFLGDFAAPVVARTSSIRCAAPPGSNYLMWSFDTFAMTESDDPAVIAGQEEVIKAVIDRDIQTEYVRRKGGIPAYRDTDPAILDPCSRASVASWKDTGEKIFLPAAEWSQSLNVIASVVRTAWHDPSQTTASITAEMIAALDGLYASEYSARLGQ